MTIKPTIVDFSVNSVLMSFGKILKSGKRSEKQFYSVVHSYASIKVTFSEEQKKTQAYGHLNVGSIVEDNTHVKWVCRGQKDGVYEFANYDPTNNSFKAPKEFIVLYRSFPEGK